MGLTDEALSAVGIRGLGSPLSSVSRCGWLWDDETPIRRDAVGRSADHDDVTLYASGWLHRRARNRWDA